MRSFIFLTWFSSGSSGDQDPDESCLAAAALSLASSNLV